MGVLTIILGLTGIAVFVLAFALLGVAMHEPEEFDRRVGYFVSYFAIGLGFVYGLALIKLLGA